MSITVKSTNAIANISIQKNGNNVFERVPVSPYEGKNALSFAQGYLTFVNGFLANADGEPGYLVDTDNRKEFVWGATDDNGDLGVQLEISSVLPYKYITLVGSKNVGQYPTSATIYKVDGTSEVVENTSGIVWRIDLLEEAFTHTIILTNWSRRSYNAILSYMSVERQTHTVEIDFSKAKSTTRIIGGVSYGIDTVFLSGGGVFDYPFRGVNRTSALGWQEPVWGGELTRTQDFALKVKNVKFGLVAQLQLKFNYLNVDDYKALMQIKNERVCYATYYDREKCEWVERQEMAFTGNELSKLYTYGTNYVGDLGITIKLVATNNDKIARNYTITLSANGGTYNLNNKAGITQANLSKSDYIWCGELQVSDDVFVKSGYHFNRWCTNPSGIGGKSYYANALLTISDDLTLYPVWEED